MLITAADGSVTVPADAADAAVVASGDDFSDYIF